MAADNSAGGGAFDWSGLFSSLASDVASVYKTVNAPTGTVYQPAVGNYVPVPGTAASVTNTLSNNTGLLLLLGFGLVALLLVVRR